MLEGVKWMQKGRWQIMAWHSISFIHSPSGHLASDSLRCYCQSNALQKPQV